VSRSEVGWRFLVASFWVGALMMAIATLSLAVLIFALCYGLIVACERL
jgi:hypothetical protein